MTRDELEVMTRDQLRDHAETMGIKVLALDSKGTMVDKLLGEYTGAVVPAVSAVPDADEPLSPFGALYTLDRQKVEAKKYKVKIFAVDKDNSDVDLIVNGHNIRVKRNVDVILMEPYVEVLRNAVIETVTKDQDTGKEQASMRMVYPFNAVAI